MKPVDYICIKCNDRSLCKTYGGTCRRYRLRMFVFDMLSKIYR